MMTTASSLDASRQYIIKEWKKGIASPKSLLQNGISFLRREKDHHQSRDFTTLCSLILQSHSAASAPDIGLTANVSCL